MSNSIPETSPSADILRYMRYRLRGRRGMVIAGTALGAPALWFGWPWLVAAGLAPILIAVAPCAVICVVGVCTMKACGTKNATDASSAPLPRPRHQASGPLADSNPAVQTGEPIATAALSQINVGRLEDRDETERDDWCGERCSTGTSQLPIRRRARSSLQ
jgi:hypothetical protein